MTLELVVAHYAARLDWLTRYAGCRVTVYSKADEPPEIDHLVPDGSVVHLPNVGYDLHTWAYHCATRYNDLAERTAFVQGDPYDHCNDLDARIALAGDDLTWLGADGFETDGDGAPHHPGLPVEAIWEVLFADQFPGKLRFSPGSQYVVPRSAIRARSLAFYAACLALLDLGPPQGRVEACAFERLMPTIWDGGKVRARL